MGVGRTVPRRKTRGSDGWPMRSRTEKRDGARGKREGVYLRGVEGWRLNGMGG